jgi:hypothetical protein
MLVHQARTRAEQVSYHALAEGLTETQLDALDTLLAPKPGTALSGMAWVRQAPQSPSARNILALVERVAKHVAPLGWEHIGLTGDYVWSSDDQPPHGSFRPLRRRESMLAA